MIEGHRIEVMKYKYRFTIFTPCYNSERFIDRVYNSVRDQTFRDFEWLVINDASTDSTDKILKKYIEISDFPIRYIENEENQMLSNNLNLAFKEAQGEFVLLAGHDDSFDKSTLEVLDDVWRKNGAENIAGIWSLCQTQNGELVGTKFPQDLLIQSYFDLFKSCIYRQERFVCARTSVLREFPFDTSRLRYVPEDVLWGKIGLKYQTIFINKVLRTYYVENDNVGALTKRSRIAIAESTFYQYTVWLNLFLSHIKKEPLLKLRFYFAYTFYGKISQKSLIELMTNLERKKTRFIVLSLMPIASLFYYLMRIKKTI